MKQKVGKWAFLGGLVVALLAGLSVGLSQMGIMSDVFASYSGLIIGLLVLAGLAIGYVNITPKETQGFLIAAVAVLLSGVAGLSAIPWVGGLLESVISYVLVLVAPAALVVALKSVYGFAQTK